MTLNPIPKQKIAITFPLTQLRKAKKKAKNELGFNLSELVRHLIANYLTDTPVPNKREWLSPEAEKRYNKEVDHFYKHELKNSKAYRSSQDLIQVLEADD